jgi:hypothetical protein
MVREKRCEANDFRALPILADALQVPIAITKTFTMAVATQHIRTFATVGVAGLVLGMCEVANRPGLRGDYCKK